MTSALTVLRRGDSLAAWELSPVTATPFPGEPAPAEDRVNYKFINGFVDVGDLPCRIATWKDIATRTVSLETGWPVESLYLPGSNRRVEFSQFRHTPMRLARWCRTYVAAPRDGEYRFSIGTCGGVNIWVDGKPAAKFEPFTRNAEQRGTIALPISAQGSEIVVLMEEMAERDTNWFFELTLLDDTALDVRLPGATAGEHTETLQRLATQVRPDGEVVADGPLVLRFDTPAPMPVAIHATVGATSHDKSTLLDRTVRLEQGATSVELCHGAELPEGYQKIDLTFIAGDTRVARGVGCAVLRDLLPVELPGDLAARKRLALEYLADHGEIRMGTALAILAIGRASDARLRAILEHTLTIIEERHDCSDFVMVPLLWAYARHAAQLPADLAERTRTAALGYRYWVDEPGNDVMWFWSENHALCFHVSQMLAGDLFPDGDFPASGRIGAEQKAVALTRLGKWFDAVEAEGLAEWNSAAYYPVDFIGLLALVEFAPADIAGRARRIVDRIFTMLALHTSGGVPAGTQGRAYDKELRAGPLTELAPFAAVAWGKGWLNRGVASLPQLAAGSYEPPDGLSAFAWPQSGKAIEARYTQGYDQAARLALYKTDALQLSTNTAAKAGSYGHQQHVIDLLFAAHPFARAWINHPGEDDPWGSQRPSYWSGNGVLPRAAQHGNVAMLHYDLGQDPRLAFTHAYVSPAGLETEFLGNAVVLRSGAGVAAIVCSQALEPITAGPGAGLEFRAYGKQVGWAVIAGESADAEAFAKQIAESRLHLDPDANALILERPGTEPLRLDRSGAFHQGSKPVAERVLSVEPEIEVS